MFLTILKKDMKIVLCDIKLMVLLLLLPLISIVFFSLVLSDYLDESSFIDPFNIAIVDKEASKQTEMLIGELEGIEIFNKIINIEESDIEKYIKENFVAGVLIIPEGFSDSLMHGQNLPVEVIGNKNTPIEAYITRNIIVSAANLVISNQAGIETIYHFNKNSGVVNDEKIYSDIKESSVKYLFESVSRNDIFRQVKGTYEYNINPVEYFTATLIIIFFMFTGMPGAKMLIDEKNNGMIDRLNSSGVGSIQVVISKFIVGFVLAFLQFVVIIIFTSIVFKNYWGISIFSSIILFLSIVFAVSGWTILVSVISKKASTSAIISNLGILLMAIIGGSIYPLAGMPDIVKIMSNLTINKWAIDGFLKIFSGKNFDMLTIDIVVLLIIGLAFLSVSIPIYMYEISKRGA